MRISVIGSGGWGTAIAVHLEKMGHNVKLWSYFENESKELIANKENLPYLPGIKLNNIDFTSDLSYAIRDAELIAIVVPSKAMRQTAYEIAKHIDVKKQGIVCLTKGLEDGSFMRMSEVIKDEIKGGRVAVLTGPSHAEEVARGMITTLVAASEDNAMRLTVQDAFMNKYLRVYVNDDIVGAELGGALKNVYALIVGIAYGLSLGDNAKAAIMTRGMTELAKLGKKMGAKLDTFYGLSGMGDLIVTCTSEHSRNRRAGMLLGKGYTLEEALAEVNMTVEGVPATIATYHLKEKLGIEMPLVDTIYKILFENLDVKKASSELMGREKKGEIEQTVEF